MNQPVLFLAGPTAVGKSEVAEILARRLKAEIISADSMQVYRGMDIGTAKPGREVRDSIPHHLLDIRDPGEPFSVFDFREMALACLKDIVSRGHLPLVVGGTGLYIRALLQGFHLHSAPSGTLRKTLESEADKKGTQVLYSRLQEIAPDRAEAIKPGDRRRIIRALEIHELEDSAAGKSRQVLSLRDLGFRPVIVGLTCDREVLYEVIHNRVDAMFEAGLVGEVEGLAASGFSATALQAVGYKEIVERLRDGKFPEDQRQEVVEAVRKATRHLAKRQMTWFRKEEGLVWVERHPGESSETIAEKVLSVFSEAV